MNTAQIHIGDSLEQVGNRFIDAWHRIERGEIQGAEIHVGFESWESMVHTLSPKRLELLRHIHRNPAKNIRTLAVALGRDYRRVHEDVETLGTAGLLERDKKGVRTGYDAFTVAMKIAL